MSDEKEFDKSFYESLPFEDKNFDIQFHTQELNALIKLLNFAGRAFEVAGKNSLNINDTDSAKIYAEQANLAFAFRNKLLDNAKVGQPKDSSKH